MVGTDNVHCTDVAKKECKLEIMTIRKWALKWTLNEWSNRWKIKGQGIKGISRGGYYEQLC